MKTAQKNVGSNTLMMTRLETPSVGPVLHAKKLFRLRSSSRAIDDPFARKMEANLVLFIDQIRLIEARLASSRLFLAPADLTRPPFPPGLRPHSAQPLLPPIV